MRALKKFRLLSSVIIFSVFVIAGGSPLNANFRDQLSDLHDSRYEETENGDVYRLPNAVIPVSYELKIAPDLENFTFAGQVNITVRIEFSTDRIILHSKNLTIENVTIVEAKGNVDNAPTSIPATHYLDDENQILIIQKSDKFKINLNYTISIKFHGTVGFFPQQLSFDEFRPKGFYRTFYKIDNQIRWLVTTQFEPTHARRAFPCFDEPRFRTPFIIHIARSKNHIAISNMPNETTDLLPPDSMSKGFGYEKFLPTPPMPTYLVAFMVSDFELLTDQTEDRKIRVIARPNSIQNGTYALKQAAKLLTYFEEYFGISYPSPKLDIVAVPRFQGGMENWGMITYSEKYVILQNNDFECEKIEITRLISHEFAHLWFGDLVTPAWYDYLWLKEGFATYFEYFATAAIEPTWNREEVFVVVMTQDIFWGETNYRRAVTWPIRKFKDIQHSFDDASYRKGAILIRMFEFMFSTKTFQSALSRYLRDGQQTQHGVTVQKNLFDAFDKQAEVDSVSHLPPRVYASDIMKTWIENIGYPLITVTRSYEQGEVNITQIPYLRSSNSENPNRDQEWIIPLTYTTKSQMQFSNVQPTHWSFANEPTSLTGFNKSDWILFNLKRSGYYRVNYDSKNWQLLIDQLMENHTQIHVLNRAQLIDDVFTLTRDRLIDCAIAGRLMKYLRNETNITPWYSAAKWFSELIRSKPNKSKSQTTLKNELRAILENPLKNIGCSSSKDDDSIAKYVKLKFLLLSTSVGINHCAKNLSEIYQKNYNRLNKIPKNLKPTIFCYALLYSDDPKQSFDHLWNSYQKSNDIYEKKQILESIFSCTDNEDVIKSVLSKIIDSKNEEISQRDIPFILKEFPSKIPAVTATIRFIDEKIPNLSKLDAHGTEFLRSLLNSIDSKIRTEEQMELVKKLETKFESLGQNEYAEYIEMVKNVRITAEKKNTYNTTLDDWFPNKCLLLNETSAI